MTLTGKQKHHLRGLAHNRQPIVSVGNAGVTPAVITELDAALAHHELVKIKLPSVDRRQRGAILETLCQATGAEVVQVIGHIGVAFRANEDPGITLP